MTGSCSLLVYNSPMYLEHFGLLEAPFSIAPDPRYLYMSERHREALAHLLYGLDSDGAFILLSGDVGTGKTTVSRCLLEQVPDNTRLALVLNPRLNAVELLQVICDELGIAYAPTDLNVKTLVDHINHFLLETHARGQKTVVLVEEAQNLDLQVLEQLRLLTNLETSQRKLLQVILLGQPELLDILDRPDLSQLAQRITARFHLSPLDEGEVGEYIGHRLAVAGCRRPVFASGAVKQIYRYSGGVPRLINVICDRALLGSFVQNRYQVDRETIHQAAREVLGESRARHLRNRPGRWSMGLVASVVFIVAMAVLTLQWGSVSLFDTLRGAALSGPGGEAVDGPEAVAIRWPSAAARRDSDMQAYRTLFGRWDIEYSEQQHGTPCYFARTQGLSCLHEVGSLQELRKLNRPAVLKLYDDFNQQLFVTLLALNGKTATLEIAGTRQAVPLDQLEYYWQGEYSLLWKSPPGFTEMIRPGYEGDLVEWLSGVMNRIQQTPEKPASRFYDADMVDRVRRFQLDHGLDDDGVVGVKTLIHINRALDQTLPELEKNS